MVDIIRTFTVPVTPTTKNKVTGEEIKGKSEVYTVKVVKDFTFKAEARLKASGYEQNKFMANDMVLNRAYSNQTKRTIYICQKDIETARALKARENKNVKK